MNEAFNQLTLAKNAFQAEDWEAAEQICLQIIQQDPHQIETLEMLGIVYCQTGQFERAIAHYQTFLNLLPDHASAHYNLGTAFSKVEQIEAAIEHYQAAIVLDPNFYQSHYNLGNAYLAQSRHEAAIAAYRQVLKLKPDHRQSLHNLGACLQNLEQFEAAADAYQQGLALKPDHAIAHNSLGEVLRKLGRVEAAIGHLKQAIALDPTFAEAHNNLGVSSYYCGQFDEANDRYQDALRLNPTYANAQLNYGFLLLLRGDLEAGFRYYEQRWAGQSLTPPTFPQPEWDGSNLDGKTILLCHEQGFGDLIQFIRYAPLVAARGGRVLVGCSAPLMRLLKTVPSIAQWVLEGEPVPPFDCYALLLSLPHILGTTLDTIPAEIPYLSAPQVSAPHTGLKVGFVWGGNSKNGTDRDRSITLTELLPLLSLAGVEFHSLQKGRSEELQQFLVAHPEITIVDLDPQLEDFADTAAAIAQLDLVISVDTSVAHLAGAMGKPVWILLNAVPDWRWFLGRTDSPWYPTARLFRQRSLRNWSNVTESIKDELVTLIKIESQKPNSSIRISDQSTDPQANQNLAIDSLSKKQIGIGFPIGGNLGWGVYGLNLALQLLNSNLEPVSLIAIPAMSLNPVLRSRLKSVLDYSQQIQTLLTQHPDKELTTNLLVLKPLGNHFATSEENRRIQGTHNIGVIFSEDTYFLPQEVEQAKRYDRIIAGSYWNAEILQSYGLAQVETVQQGIDPTLFHPAPKSGLLRDRFVIFSGGKLEYRKG
ncbi:MAG: tetratricopeptide repeat protein, partial [Phormidesmis sp. CAN_BIN36]|nr:tetratricopeptide repeat protein [Phormidesmis sp. CAN_BIN36]